MRKQIKIKQLVAILLPIVFILGIVYAIPNMISLRADDSSSQLTVQKGDEDITGKDISIPGVEVKLKLTAKENQLYQLPQDEKLSISSASPDSQDLPIRKVSSSEFNLENELSALKDNTNKGKKSNEIIHVTDAETNKIKTYLKLLKNETENLIFSREIASENVVVNLENVEGKSEQKLFTFRPVIAENPNSESEVQEDVKKTNENKEDKEDKEEESKPLKGDETLQELEEREYSQKESFKPIELPLEKSNLKKGTKDTTPINVTGAKIKIRSGTESFDAPKDGDTHPGYDKDDQNDWVRTFDSSIYILSFSLEGSNPGVKYSEIKYRVDMDLPNAEGFDNAGKKRENFGIEAESTDGMTTEGDGSKTDNGYVESTINSNGQILLPIFINVFGAEHKTPITPTFKITIISAKNETTGAVEPINKVYDKANLSALDIPTKKVSAEPNITTKITKGQQAPFGNTVSGGDWSGTSTATLRSNYQVAGLGIAIKLAPLTGRGSADFRGSTFPSTDINITIKTPESRYKPSTVSSTAPWNIVPPTTAENSKTGAYPVKIIAARWASESATVSEWNWFKHKSGSRALNINSALLSTDIPYGKGLQSLKEQPTVDDKTKIGVYDTGDVTLSTDTQLRLYASTNTGRQPYQPVWNQYTYNMNNSAVSKNDKFFASMSLYVEWNNYYFANQSSSAKSYQSDVMVDTISYNGKTHAGGKDKQTFTVNSDPGVISQHIPFTYAHNQETGDQGLTLGGTGNGWNGTGSSIVPRGYEFTISARYSDQTYTTTSGVLAYARWNANSIEYDSTKKTMLSPGGHKETTWTYGVKKSGGAAPPIALRTMTQIQAEYDWYATPEAAKAKGKISALRIVATKNCHGFAVQIPVKAVGPINNYSDGATFGAGGRNVCLMNSEVRNTSGGIKFARPDYRINQYYESSIFNTSGVKTGGHYIRTTSSNSDQGSAGIQASAGDSLFISGASITTTTVPDKPTYRTSENVGWTITGNASGGNTNHKVRLTTTIPKGLEYVTGSSKLIIGGSTTTVTPTKTTDASGNTILIWNITGVNPGVGDRPEIKFETKPDVKNLTFKDSSIAEIGIKTVGDIWINSIGEDKTDVKMRESSGKVDLYQIQQISLEKSVVPDYIEVGDKDAGNSSLSTDIKYKIKLTNNSSDSLADVRVLDVLPYNGSLGTSINGTYKVTGVKFTKGSGKIYYKNSLPLAGEADDPNKINVATWGGYVPGTTPIVMLNGAKSILIQKDLMVVDEELEFEITISPTGQIAGNIFRNQAVFNSHLDLPVKSNIVETKVFSRDLTGYVWYDDDYDGLIGTKKDGTPEDPVGDIPVKLYRTSQENTGYKKQLVRQSLTGEAFIDGSGNSLIKTKASGADKGKYEFKNLPEGEYIAEFIVGDIVVTKKVVIVTKQLVGSDMTLNSKADPASPFRTPEKKSDGTPFYKQPILSDLPTLLTGTDKVFHIPDVNAGLTRLSKIKLFKYEEGTVFDKDGDGHLSDEEIEDTTYTRALEGAEFDIYKGKSDDPDPADKIDHQVTDSKGWLEFVGLPPGDYTIVETKAPAGFELIKKPIHVNVPTFNYVAVVHVGDSAQTKLPFTGSTKAARIVLIASATLCVIGMIGVFLQFRPTKTKGGR